MAVWFEKLVFLGVLLVGEHGCMHFPYSCIGKAPAIGAGKFIVLEKYSNTNEVVSRTFIALDGPPGVGERITVIIEDHTLGKAMPRISCPMGIPPKPSDMVATSKATACGDHF